MNEPIDPAVLRDLAPSGVVRAAINLGNTVLAQRDAATGAPRGVSVDLAQELARRLGVGVELVLFDAAGKVFEALHQGAWDVAFLAVDPSRGEQIEFTAPYMLIEGNYIVRSDSPVKSSADVDRPGVRVAVGAGSAYDLFLKRNLRAAQIDHRPTAAAAFELFLEDGLDAAAGVKQVVRKFAESHAGVRVLDDAFMVIEQAIGIPKTRVAGAQFLSTYVEEMKRSGFVANALRLSGQSDATVALSC